MIHAWQGRGGFEVDGAYGVRGTPSAVRVATPAALASRVAAGSDEIERLIRETLDPPRLLEVPARLANGAPAADPGPRVGAC